MKVKYIGDSWAWWMKEFEVIYEIGNTTWCWGIDEKGLFHFSKTDLEEIDEKPSE